MGQMVDLSFISNEYAKAVAEGTLEAVLETAGPNFNIPYNSVNQISDNLGKNTEYLLQFALPGNLIVAPSVDTGFAKSIGTAINDLMKSLAPIMTVFGWIGTIVGVIKAIIEVLCALINPRAVKKAVKKLIKEAIMRLKG